MPLRPSPQVPVEAIATTFAVGGHAVKVARLAHGRWSASVDGEAAAGVYPTQAEAWEAGVRAADLLDHPRS